MILFHDIVQILPGADPASILPSEIELVPHSHPAQAEWVASKPLSVMVRRCPCRLSALRKNAFGAAISRVRLRCDSTVLPHASTARYKYIHCPPTLIYVNIRFLAALWRAHGALVRKPAFGKIDGISDDPSQNRAGSHADAEFAHDLRQIPVTELESQIPVHAADDGVVAEPALCEQRITRSVVIPAHF